MTQDAPPRRRLIDAAIGLLGDQPAQEPTTRQLCALAGVAAPSLYHHFGDKDGLLAVVFEQSFEAYLARKRAVVGTGDLLKDFVAGWDMHIQFGLDNPLLYTALYASARAQSAGVTRIAAEELRREFEEMDRAGLLQVSVDDAVSATSAASIGCVLQLLREGGTLRSPLSPLMRDALLHRLCGTVPDSGDRRGAVRSVLASLSGAEEELGREEAALLKKWLARLDPGR